MIMTKLEIAKILKSCRISAGFTQSEAASKIGRPQQTLASWETGKSQPDANTLFALCDLYGVSVDHAFGYGSLSSSPTCCEFSKFLGEDAPPTNSELELLRKLRALSPVHRAAIETLVEQFYPVDSGEKRGDISGTA